MGELGGVQNIPPVAPFPNLYLGVEGTFLMIFLNFVLFVTSFTFLSNLLQLPSREVKKVVVLSYILFDTFTILFWAGVRCLFT